MRLGFIDVSRLPSADGEGDLLPGEPTLASECPVIVREWNELDTFLIHDGLFYDAVLIYRLETLGQGEK